MFKNIIEGESVHNYFIVFSKEEKFHSNYCETEHLYIIDANSVFISKYLKNYNE